MKKAQSERPRDEARVPSVFPAALGWLDPAPWLGMSGLAWKEGLKWMELWQRESQRMWGMRPVVSVSRGPRNEGDRRVSDMPWVPRIEAQVIPLRRNTDPPGGEATRFSMRVPLPWADGNTNIVSIQTILGRGESGERREERSADGAGKAQHPGARRG